MLKNKPRVFFVLGTLIVGVLLLGQFGSCSTLDMLHYHPVWRTRCWKSVGCIKADYQTPFVSGKVWAPSPYDDYEEAVLSKQIQENISKKIVSLGTLFGDDIQVSGCGMCIPQQTSKIVKISMIDRKRNFSDSGWAEYQKYVERGKANLRRAEGLGISRMSEESKQYLVDKDNDGFIFLVDGLTLTRTEDTIGAEYQYHLAVSFIPKDSDAENIMITHWKMDLLDYRGCPIIPKQKL